MLWGEEWEKDIFENREKNLSNFKADYEIIQEQINRLNDRAAQSHSNMAKSVERAGTAYDNLLVSMANYEAAKQEIKASIGAGRNQMEMYASGTRNARDGIAITPLTTYIRQKLLIHKQEQESNKELFGNYFAGNNYIFTWPDRKLISPNYLSRTFHKTIASSSLPQIRLHDLRHSVASNLLCKGFSVVEAAQWLGHSEASTTLNFYAHVDSTSKRNIVKALEKQTSLENG